MPREREDIRRALIAKGFVMDAHNRDHDFLFLHRVGSAVFTKLSRGGKYRTLGDDLLSKMARQLHLSRGEFFDLVDCPMDELTYVAALRSRGVLHS